jgi:hypothetical protein
MQRETEKFVIIRVANPSRILPNDVQSDTTNTIGSKFDRTKKGIPLMGLSDIERRFILPSLLEVKPDSPEWNKAVASFYANLTIKPDPIDGIKLNIASSKVKFEGVEIDNPLSPNEYIQYRQCLIDPTVAKSFKEAKEGTYQFYIDDEQLEKQREIETSKSIQKLEYEYIKLCELNQDDEYVNVDQMKMIVRLLGKNPIGMPIDEMALIIKDCRNRSIRQVNEGNPLSSTEFISIIKDPDIKPKSFILSLVENEIIIKQGEHYLDADDDRKVLGEGLEKVVNFIKDQNNSDTINKFKYKLKAVKESQLVS